MRRECRVKARVAVIGGGQNCDTSSAQPPPRRSPPRWNTRATVLSGSMIGTDGTWHDDGARLPDLADAVRILSGCDAVVPVVHGPRGEDGTLKSYAAHLAGITCVGSGPQAGALGMDKHVTKLIAADCGIATAPAVLLTTATAAW